MIKTLKKDMLLEIHLIQIEYFYDDLIINFIIEFF